MHHTTVLLQFIILILSSINIGYTIICVFIIVNHKKYLGTSFSSSKHGYNISNLLKIENHVILVTRMYNSLEEL